MDKTIVFCVNQQHASDMKIAIDKFKTVKDNNYCVRVTSDEGDIGRNFLEQFQNNDLDIPTILTSSKMLTTGKVCKRWQKKANIQKVPRGFVQRGDCPRRVVQGVV